MKTVATDNATAHESRASGPPQALVARARELALRAARPEGVTTGLAAAEAALEQAESCAAILTEIDADPGAIAAAWLYGQPETIPLVQVENEFGDDIARLVDGMRKLRRLREIHGGHDVARGSRAAEARLETLRRMLLALSVDVRVVLLRLASRLATLRRHARAHTVPDLDLCRETLDVLAPLANRLGVWVLKWQLEDLAFRFLEPDAYHELAKTIELKRAERERLIATSIVMLSEALHEARIPCEVLGRPKHLYGLATKMRNKGLAVAQVHDLHALRVIVRDVPACYQALDVVHALWSPIPSEFDDYISAPKSNGYRSLHSIVIRHDGARLEVQIRTREMHEAAEYGDASHWRYKEGLAASPDDGFQQRVAWLRQLLAWQREVGQSIGVATEDGSPDPSIYVMTPQGRVIVLPADATPIDFAYAVHSDIGHRCRGARVDGVQVPLTRRLATGQTVEIVLARGQGKLAAGPSRDWLNAELGYIVSQRARTKVRQWFAAHNLGHDATSAGAAGHSNAGAATGAPAAASAPMATSGVRNVGAVGTTNALLPAEQQVADAAVRAINNRNARRRHRGGADAGVLIEGVGSLMTQLARCCRPLPPDPIAGYLTRGAGVTVHRRECRVLRQLSEKFPERTVTATWASRSDASESGAHSRESRSPTREAPRYPVDLEITGRAGAELLKNIAELLARDKIALVAATRSDRGESGLLRVTIEMDDARGLPGLLARIQRAPGVLRAVRR